MLQTEQDVISALEQGPVFATMRVNRCEFGTYRCGVFCDRPLSSSFQANHAVEVVDYSNYNFTGTPYWVVKNSMGTDFGEGGYFRIARGQGQLTSFIQIDSNGNTPSESDKPSLRTCAAEDPSDQCDQDLIENLELKYSITVVKLHVLRTVQLWPL